MTLQTANVGLANNDHNGDTLRSAITKFNTNFIEIYAAAKPNSTYGTLSVPKSITLGNASIYAVVNSSYFTGTAYNADNLGNVFANNYALYTANGTYTGNNTFTSSNTRITAVNVGNSSFQANTTKVTITTQLNSTNTIATTGLANVGTLSVSGNASVSGNLVVAGQLFIAGNTTFVNASVVTTHDKYFVVSDNANTASAANGSGIVVGSVGYGSGPYIQFLYNDVYDAWQSNGDIIPSSNNFNLGNNAFQWNLNANVVIANLITTASGNLFIDPAGNSDVVFSVNTEVFIYSNAVSTNSTSGALVVNGSIGVSGNSFFAGNIDATALTVANGNYFSANSTQLYTNDKVQIGNQAGYNFGNTAAIEIDLSSNTYLQVVIQNASNGAQATGDLVVTADTGNDSYGYVDLGINSSLYSNSSYSIGGPLDAYLYSSNSNLTVGTATIRDLIFHAGGTQSTHRVMTVNTTAVTIANSQNLVANVASLLTSISIGSNVIANTSLLTIGNNSINTTVNSSSFSVGSSFLANTTGIYTTGIVNAASVTVGGAEVINATGIYTTGTVDASSLTVGGAETVNATGIYTNGTVNAASITVGGAEVINATGVYTTGTVNALSYKIGTSFTANTVGISSNGFVANTTGVYSNTIQLQTIQVSTSVNFGGTPVYTKVGTISDSRVTTNSTFTTIVSMFASGANSLANGTSNTVYYGDELEMDNYQCAAYVSSNGVISYSITAAPGPVSNTRIFNYILS